MRRGLLLLLLLCPAAVSIAQWNSWQPFQPWKNNAYSRIAGGGPTGYNYGYPAYGAVEPNVKAQFLFQEHWSQFTGISVSSAGGQGFRYVGTPAALAPGTSDFTIEFVATATNTAAYRVMWDTGNNAFINGGVSVYYSDTDVFVLDAYQTPGSGFSVSWTPDATIVFDGNPHKYRVVADRDGNAELFIDGVSQGTTSIAAHSAKNIGITRVELGCTAGVAGWNGTIFEFRQSHNITNNSGGPGEGTYPYDYGSSGQTGVATHFKMQEASGNLTSSAADATVLTPISGGNTYSIAGSGFDPTFIYDEVSGIRLQQADGKTTKLSANTTVTGDFAGLSPGITTTDSGTPTSFYNRSANSSLNVGSGDHVVIEIWRQNFGTNGAYLFTLNGSSGSKGILIYLNSMTSVEYWFEAEDASQSQKAWTVTNLTTYADPVKFRFVFERSSKAVELFINGVSQGTGTLTNIASTDTITNNGIAFAHYSSTSGLCPGIHLEGRVSIGSDVLSNNSGGPGGG